MSYRDMCAALLLSISASPRSLPAILLTRFPPFTGCCDECLPLCACSCILPLRACSLRTGAEGKGGGQSTIIPLILPVDAKSMLVRRTCRVNRQRYSLKRRNERRVVIEIQHRMHPPGREVQLLARKDRTFDRLLFGAKSWVDFL